MVAFARFVMRDNGLAVHISAQQVTQVRQTTEGEPAIYIAGRDTPMIVEGTLEMAIRKLEGAAAGIKIVEPAVELVMEAPVAEPPALEIVTAEVAPEPEAAAEPAPEPEVVLAAKGKPAKTKAVAKVKPQKAKPAAKSEASALKEPEAPYPTASWFKGNR